MSACGDWWSLTDRSVGRRSGTDDSVAKTASKTRVVAWRAAPRGLVQLKRVAFAMMRFSRGGKGVNPFPSVV